MILVLASVIDAAAASFATELAAGTAASLMTCADLASAPLALRHPDFETSTITVDGKTTAVTAIRGVVNLLPVVFPSELVFYDEEEREYQAAELHALLTFFLSSLACPVLNRATAASLTGPFPNPLGWRQLARKEGIPVTNIEMSSTKFANPFVVPSGAQSFEVTCLGGRVLGPPRPELDLWTLRLASLGGVEYLRAVYTCAGSDKSRLLSASTVPDVTSTLIRAALIDYLASRS